MKKFNPKQVGVFFDSLPKRVFLRREIKAYLGEHLEEWGMANTAPISKILNKLLKISILEKIRFKFPDRGMIRYVRTQASELEIVQSLGPTGYFSHYSAMAIHGLTEQIPNNIYLNQEQTPKPKPQGRLRQENIDRVFGAPPRMSNRFADYLGKKVYLLNGKFTKNLGVINFLDSRDQTLRVTGLERTLIDCATRPFYAGGIFEILKAFERAGARFSSSKALAILEKLDYIYPYHQVVGFFMERAGCFTEKDIEVFRKAPFEFDFYLSHQMGETDWDPKWRLHYPRGF